MTVEVSTVADDIRGFLRAHPRSTQDEIGSGIGKSRAHIALTLKRMPDVLSFRERRYNGSARPCMRKVFSVGNIATVAVRLGGTVRCPSCQHEFDVILGARP